MKKLVRSYDEKYVGGVCGGIGKAIDIDPALVRISFVFLTGVTGLLPGIVTYFFGWAITPMKSAPAPLARIMPKRKKGIPTEKRSVAPAIE